MAVLKRVPKPWGGEIWFAVHARYAGKILNIRKGHRLSLQYHRFKHETIFVQKGKLKLRLGNRTKVLKPGEAQAIAPKTVHRFEAPWGPVQLLEVSTAQLKDVVRLEDDYGRTQERKSV